MNVINRIFLISSFLLLGLYNGFAQVPVVKSINKVILEGRIYYIHVVKPGQTLYSISETYEISIEEIVMENPGVDKSLPAGQVLKIPATPGIVPSTLPDPVTDNQKFIQHIIQQGETLYSLSKRYFTTVQEIEKANPGLNYTDLPIGQMIYIPGGQDPAVQKDFISHKVRRRETIYGIAKHYHITEEQLKTYNPELRNTYPRRGQILRIPKFPEPVIAIIPDSVQVVKTDSTLQILPVIDSSINISYDYYLDSLPDISGRPVNVAFLIPFNYSVIAEPEPVDTLNNLQGPADQDKEDVFEDLLPENVNLLEFMEGSLLAIDHLRQKGISVHLTFYDTKRSSDRVREIINSPDFDKTDLIIGPFYAFNVEIVTEYSKQHYIPVISPFYNGTELTDNNPYMFQVTPSLVTEYDHIAAYLANIADRNIIYIHSTDSMGTKKFDHLKSQILDRLALKGNLSYNQFTEIIYDNINKSDFLKELANILSKDKENLVVIPETDEVFVKAILPHLFFHLKKLKISLIGMPEWISFQLQPEDYSYLHKLNLSYFTPFYYSYDSSDIKYFLKEFSRKFYIEPVSLTNKGCPYGFIGYDLSRYFLSSMNKYGKQFILNLQDTQGGQLLNDFRFEKVGVSGGFENRSLMRVKLLPDMSVVAFKVEPAPLIKSPVSQQDSIIKQE